MARTPKKQFFQEPTKAEIVSQLDNFVSADSNLIKYLDNLEPNQGLIIETKLIPAQFENSNKFLKHASPVEIFLKDRDGEISYRNEDGSIPIPVELREKEFNAVNNKAHPGYSFMPDNIVQLTECLEAARIFHHSYHTYPHQLEGLCLIEVKPYDDALKVAEEGTVAVIKISSRRQNIPRYKYSYIYVPVLDNENEFEIISKLKTKGHCCELKQYSFKYNLPDDPDPSDRDFWCAHEIAAFWRLIDFYKHMRGIKIPAAIKMNPFAIPTQYGVNLYKKIISKTLIRDEDLETKDKLRKPEKGEEEVLLWGSVYIHKHKKTFYAENKLLRDYNWAL